MAFHSYRLKSAQVLLGIIFFGILAAVEFFGVPEASPNSPLLRVSAVTSKSTTTATVLRVIDGDTIEVDISGTKTRVRLIGINTPEVVDPRRPVECFGQEASHRAKEILSGNAVLLVSDSSQGELDKYGRSLFYVYLSDGTFFNDLMLKEGYAHEYTYRTPYRYQAQFKASEQVARSQHVGLWEKGRCL